jgi:phospholipid/cholesterol/gamma-HCH transport system substrate-binding protein
MERLGRRLAGDRALLAESLQSLEPAIKSLSGQRRQILTLMKELRRLSKVGTATVESTRADMLSVLADLGPVLSTLTARQAEFRETLDGIHDFAVATDSATLGLFLNFDLTTLFDGDVLPTGLPPVARPSADEQKDAR